MFLCFLMFMYTLRLIVDVSHLFTLKILSFVDLKLNLVIKCKFIYLEKALTKVINTSRNVTELFEMSDRIFCQPQ